MDRAPTIEDGDSSNAIGSNGVKAIEFYKVAFGASESFGIEREPVLILARQRPALCWRVGRIRDPLGQHWEIQ